MTNRLFRYELALFRRAFADAFSRPADKILLAFVLLLSALIVPGWLRDLSAHPLPPKAAAGAVAAFLPGHAWQRLVAGRLRWLAGESTISADALDPSGRRRYIAAAHLLLIPLVVGALSILASATGMALSVLLGLAAYGAGAAVGGRRSMPRRRPRIAAAPGREPRASGRRRTAFLAVLRRQTLNSRRPALAAVLALAGLFLATAAAAAFGAQLQGPAAFALAAAPSLAAAAMVARLDAELLGFLPFAGFGPAFGAFAVAALPVACFIAASLGALAAGFGPSAFLLGLLLLYALVAITSVARAWLYPGRSRRSVDVQIQVELGAGALLAVTFPPLAPLVIAGRLFVLQRRYRALLWKPS